MVGVQMDVFTWKQPWTNWASANCKIWRYCLTECDYVRGRTEPAQQCLLYLPIVFITVHSLCRKKCLHIMVQLQFLVMVLLKLSWFINTLKRSMYIIASCLIWCWISEAMMCCILVYSECVSRRLFLLVVSVLSQCSLGDVKATAFC